MSRNPENWTRYVATHHCRATTETRTQFVYFLHINNVLIPQYQTETRYQCDTGEAWR
jgi:hypothetical protein